MPAASDHVQRGARYLCSQALAEGQRKERIVSTPNNRRGSGYPSECGRLCLRFPRIEGANVGKERISTILRPKRTEKLLDAADSLTAVSTRKVRPKNGFCHSRRKISAKKRARFQQPYNTVQPTVKGYGIDKAEPRNPRWESDCKIYRYGTAEFVTNNRYPWNPQNVEETENTVGVSSQGECGPVWPITSTVTQQIHYHNAVAPGQEGDYSRPQM